MNFPIDFQSPSDLNDWEILSVHMYLRVMIEKSTPVGIEEYELFLKQFSGNKASLDAWLYKLTKQFEYEFENRHRN